MNIDTHLNINQRLCGTPALVDSGFTPVEMVLTAEMAADAAGLVHGGLIPFPQIAYKL